MFKNLKIGVRLGFGFGLVIILLIVTAVVGYTRVSYLNDEINIMVEDRFPKTVLANQIVDQINVTARAIRNAMLVKTPEEAGKELDRLYEARKITGAKFAELEKTITTEEGKKGFAKVMEARRITVAEQDQSLVLFKAGKKDEAIDLLVTKIRKSQGDYLKTVDELISFQSGLMTKSGKEASEAAASAKQMLVILTSIATLIALAFAWWVTVSITRPVNEALNAANRLAEGDLTVKLDADSKDEVGLLMNAMQNMIAKLTQIIGEVRTAADNLTNAAGQVLAIVVGTSRIGGRDHLINGTDDRVDLAEHRERQGHRRHGLEVGQGSG